MPAKRSTPFRATSGRSGGMSTLPSTGARTDRPARRGRPTLRTAATRAAHATERGIPQRKREVGGVGGSPPTSQATQPASHRRRRRAQKPRTVTWQPVASSTGGPLRPIFKDNSGDSVPLYRVFRARRRGEPDAVAGGVDGRICPAYRRPARSRAGLGGTRVAAPSPARRRACAPTPVRGLVFDVLSELSTDRRNGARRSLVRMLY